MKDLDDPEGSDDGSLRTQSRIRLSCEYKAEEWEDDNNHIKSVPRVLEVARLKPHYLDDHLSSKDQCENQIDLL